MYKLDLSKAKIKEITHLSIPFAAFGIDISHIEKFNTDLIGVYNSEKTLLGFASLVKDLAGNLCLDLNVEFNSPERLNIDNGEFYLELTPKMVTTMIIGHHNGVIEPEIVVHDLHIDSITILTNKQHQAKHRNPTLEGTEW